MGSMPSSADMQRLQKNLRELSESTFGKSTVGERADNHLLLAGKTRGDLVSQEEMQALRDNFASTEADFLAYLVPEIQRVEEDFMGSFAITPSGQRGTGKNHLLGVMFNGFHQALGRGEYKFMARDINGGSMFAGGVYNGKKKKLCWTLVGFTIVELEKKGLLDPPVGTPMGALRRYNYIGTVLMPDFIRQLTMLLATLQSKMSEVEFLKQKFLAGAVSVFIAGAPIAVKMIQRAAGYEDDTSSSAIQIKAARWSRRLLIVIRQALS